MRNGILTALMLVTLFGFAKPAWADAVVEGDEENAIDEITVSGLVTTTIVAQLGPFRIVLDERGLAFFGPGGSDPDDEVDIELEGNLNILIVFGIPQVDIEGEVGLDIAIVVGGIVDLDDNVEVPILLRAVEDDVDEESEDSSDDSDDEESEDEESEDEVSEDEDDESEDDSSSDVRLRLRGARR